MLKIKLLNGKYITIDPSNLQTGALYDDLYAALSSSPVLNQELLEIAYLYRNDYIKSKELLELAKIKETTSGLQVSRPEVLLTIKIQRIALQLHHNREVKNFFDELCYVQDRRIDFLKGFYFMKIREFEEANFLFLKIGYFFGVDLNNLSKGRQFEAKSGDVRISSYLGPERWGEIEGADVNFMYRIGKSEVYSDAENVDVQLRMVEDAFRSSESINYESLINRLNALESSPEILYLIGKVYHIKKEYENAKVYFRQALEQNPEYLPAVFNLNRIEGKAVCERTSRTVINDYNAILAMKNGSVSEFGGVLYSCSDEVRRMFNIAVRVKAFDGEVVSDLKRLLYSGNNSTKQNSMQNFNANLADTNNLFNKDAIANNLAILLKNKEEAICLLKETLKNCESKYEDILKYNLGLISEDIRLLSESPFPEANDQISLIKNNTLTDNFDLQCFLTVKADPEIPNQKALLAVTKELLLQKTHCLFSVILLGTIFINEYIEDGNMESINSAIKVYKLFPTSFYCINGLGVCYAIKGKMNSAIKLLRQITSDFIESWWNLGNCYIILGDNKSAIECYIKGGNLNIGNLCIGMGDLGLINKYMEAGVPGLEYLRDQLSKEINKPEDDERIKKRKIMEEYRKGLSK